MKKRTFLIGAAAMTGAIIAFRQIFKQENTTDLKSKYNDLSKESNSEKEFSLEDPTEEFVLKLSEHIIYGNISDLMLFDIKRELLCTAIFHVIGSDTEKLYIDMDKELHKVLNLLISKTWEEELKKDSEDTLAWQYYLKLAEFDEETKIQVLREVILQLGANLAKHSFTKENDDSDSMEFPEMWTKKQKTVSSFV